MWKNQVPDIIPMSYASPTYTSYESTNPSKNRHYLHSLCLCLDSYFNHPFMRTTVVPVTWIFNTWLLTPYQCHWVQETPHDYVPENIFLQDVMSYHFIELFHFWNIIALKNFLCIIYNLHVIIITHTFLYGMIWDWC